MRILKVSRQQMLNFAIKHNLHYIINDLKHTGSCIDGSTVESFVSNAGFLDEYVQTHLIPSSDEVIFVNKKDIMALFSERAMSDIGIIHEIRYNRSLSPDLLISVLGEYQKYFNSEHYVEMRDIQQEDYMEFFYESICTPILNALESAGAEVSKWTYIATIDFVLDNIVPDQNEVAACKSYLAACSVAI